MVRSRASSPSSQGFGLLEVILVFALVIGAGAIVFGVFQSANRRAQVANTMDKVNTIVANVRSSTFGSVNQRGALTTDVAVKSGILTPGLALNGWGGAIEVSGGSTYTPPAFQVILRHMPRDACPDLVVAASANRSMARASINASGTTGKDVNFVGIVVTNPVNKNFTYSTSLNQCKSTSGTATGDDLDVALLYTYSGRAP